MAIEFPNANKSNTSGATAPAAKAAPSAPFAPNHLMPPMTLGAPPAPPDFAGSVDGWVKAIREMLWPQTQVAAGNQSTSDAKSEESEGHSEGSKRDTPRATVNVASPDVRNGVEFKKLYNEDGKVIGKKSEQGDFYGKPVDPDHALA